jgi:hypothetical protein
MIFYVNGDSHTAGAEAVNPYAFAEDDGNLAHLGRLPHPDNLAVSWGKKLSTLLKMAFFCDAESGASNERILRTTKEYINNYPQDVTDLFVVIGWSTWEREEWLIDDVYYQVNASGIDDVPYNYGSRYKQYIADVDWDQKTNLWHENIWDLHTWLDELSIKHIFFNCNLSFSDIHKDKRRDWGINYINPYTNAGTYDAYLKSLNCEIMGNYHFGEDGHTMWSKYLLKYIVKNNLV